MDTKKKLLAFLLALPAGTDADLANDTALKQLRNKLKLINQSEITPKDWKNIQGKLQAILVNEKYATLSQLYQQTLAELEDVDITSDLLPTQAELTAIQSANREVGTLGFPPGKPELESNEIINLAIIVLSHDEPAKTSQTLLQRLTDFLKKAFKLRRSGL